MVGGGIETVVVVAEVLVVLSRYPPPLLPTPLHFYLDIQTHTSARAHTNTNTTTHHTSLPPSSSPPPAHHTTTHPTHGVVPSLYILHYYVISFAGGRIHTHTYTHTYSHVDIYTHRTHGTTTTKLAAMGPGRERRKALFYPQTLPTTTALLYSTLLFLFTKVSKPYCHHHSTRSSRTITIIYI